MDSHTWWDHSYWIRQTDRERNARHLGVDVTHARGTNSKGHNNFHTATNVMHDKHDTEVHFVHPSCGVLSSLFGRKQIGNFWLTVKTLKFFLMMINRQIS